MSKKTLISLVASTGFLLAAIPVFAGTTSLSGYAWSSNIGWLSFNSSDSGAGGGPYGVTLSTTTGSSVGTLSGYAWSPNIGWVSFDRSVAGNPPSNGTADPGSGNGPIATVNMTTGAVNGWARAIAGCASDLWNGTNCTGTGPGNDNGVTTTGGSNGSTQTTVNFNGPITWAAHGPTEKWSGITSDSSGQYLAATVYGGQIWTSSDSGKDWFPHGPTNYWTAITSSSDGKTLYATSFGGVSSYDAAIDQIWTSSDSGKDWTTVSNTYRIAWDAITSSSNGPYIFATYGGGTISYGSTAGSNIQYSPNNGVSWGESTPAMLWSALTSSSDGQYFAAVPYQKQVSENVSQDQIWTSSNHGLTLTAHGPKETWLGITSDSSGQYLAATAWGSQVWTSSDHGNTWFPHGPTGNWTGITSSSDGTKLAAGSSNDGTKLTFNGGLFLPEGKGPILTSIDSGANWISSGFSVSVRQSGITSSGDGSMIAVAANNDQIYIGTYPTTTTGGTSNTTSSNTGWDGWIELSGTNHPTGDASGNGGVTYITSSSPAPSSSPSPSPSPSSSPAVSSGGGSLIGYAWGSDVVGWLNFAGGGSSGGGNYTGVYVPGGGGTPLDLTLQVQDSGPGSSGSGSWLSSVTYTLPSGGGSVQVPVKWNPNSATSVQTATADWGESVGSSVSPISHASFNASGSDSLTFSTAGTRTLKLSYLLSGNQNTKTVNVTVLTPPPQNNNQCIIPTHAIACSNNSSTATATYAPGGICDGNNAKCEYTCDTVDGYKWNGSMCAKSSIQEI